MSYVRLAVCGMLLLAFSITTYAAPKADLWPRWQQHDPRSTRTIDHSQWQAWLTKYVDARHASGITRVRYAAVTGEDRQAVRRYVDMLQHLPVSTYNQPEQKAYWINLYNAFTVLLILEHYPVASIRDINIDAGLFDRGPWKAKLLRIEGEQLSLNDLEHRILRPIWSDNRVHYALNCASLGCPNLAPLAYTTANLEALLEQGARAYVNHPRGAMVDQERLRVSSIYVWFQEDFGDSSAGVLQHLRRYAEGQLAEQLQGYTGKLYHAYDWRLNAP
jgi:hypothetical protein